MSDAPTSARAVVIGCGIVGNSLAYHLTRLGRTDVVLLDKGPLPNPGGSRRAAAAFAHAVAMCCIGSHNPLPLKTRSGTLRSCRSAAT